MSTMYTIKFPYLEGKKIEKKMEKKITHTHSQENEYLLVMLLSYLFWNEKKKN